MAVGSALLYLVWVVWAPLLPANLYIPLLDLGKITGYTWPAALELLSLVLLLYVLYAAGYWLVARGGVGLAAIFATGGVVCFELLWVYPATAADVFGYVAHGRLLALYHLNPLIVAPDAIPSDPIVGFLAFPGEPSQYGPAWILLGGAIAAVAHAGLSASSAQALLEEVLLYKTVAAAAHVAGAAIVYRVACRLTRDRPRARASAFAFLLNPTLLWETVGNAHNDATMMLFGLLAVWLFVARMDLLVLLALALGALVKAPVVLIGPILFIGMWRRGRARAVEGALLAALLVGVAYRPFWQGLDTLTPLRRTELFTASIGSVVRLALAPGLGLADATAVARWVSLVGFGVVALIAVYHAARAHTAQDALRPAYMVLLAGVLLATTWFQAWYIVWPFGLAAALAEPRRHLEVALLALGGLLQYVVFIYLWVMGYFPPTENLGVQCAAYLCIVAPLGVGLAAPRWLARRRCTVYRRAQST